MHELTFCSRRSLSVVLIGLVSLAVSSEALAQAGPSMPPTAGPAIRPTRRRPSAPTKHPAPAPAPAPAPEPAPAPAPEVSAQQRYGTMPGSELPAPTPAPAGTAASSPRRWHMLLGCGFGVGMGYAVGKTETLKLSTNSGMAVAETFHVAPEVGAYISNTFLLSLMGRIQSISSVNVKEAGGEPLYRSAFALLLKLTWMPERLGFRPYFNVAVGGGTIRHVVKFPDYSAPCGGVTCLDNVAASGFMVGPGLGFYIDLGSNLHIVAAGQALLIAGPGRSTVNLDGTGGLALSF